VPAADDLADRFRSKGIGNDSDVVLYAAGDAWWATRVWWMLHSIGFDRAAILDGGLRKWRAEGRPIEREPRSYAAATSLTAQPRDAFCDKTSVQAALGTGDAIVLNCLRTEQHDGSAAHHYGRPGHITGSVNVPAASLFAPDGTFRPASELRALFEAKGIVPGKRTVAYCGGGIAATGDAFALTALLGFDRVTVYDNSLQEWAADPTLPMSV
jgi:thiosulfate/3-mercaptopyruvate sulfurtransferase